MFCNTISNTKYQTHKQCPLKYSYKYVDKYEEDSDTNTDALHFGSYIHKILEEGVNATTFKELEGLSESLRKNYTFGGSYEPKIGVCIKNFLHFNASLKENVATELRYSLDLQDDISVNGVIDRIIRGADGGFLVIDYKTSKREKSRLELYEDEQMKGYCYAVHKLYEVPIKDITIAHYYPLTDNLVTVSYSPVQIHSFLKSIVEEVWKIRKAKKTDFCPRENEFCNWCGYKSLCPKFNDSMLVESRLKTRKKRARY